MFNKSKQIKKTSSKVSEKNDKTLIQLLTEKSDRSVEERLNEYREHVSHLTFEEWLSEYRENIRSLKDHPYLAKVYIEGIESNFCIGEKMSKLLSAIEKKRTSFKGYNFLRNGSTFGEKGEKFGFELEELKVEFLKPSLSNVRNLNIYARGEKVASYLVITDVFLNNIIIKSFKPGKWLLKIEDFYAKWEVEERKIGKERSWLFNREEGKIQENYTLDE